MKKKDLIDDIKNVKRILDLSLDEFRDLYPERNWKKISPFAVYEDQQILASTLLQFILRDLIEEEEKENEV